MCIYYVYAYLRKDGTPYYIGKGKGRRAWSKDHNVHLPTEKFRIVIIESNLTNVGACAIERRLITWHGRKDLGTGILRNKTDGGEGATGVILSEDRKKKISLYQTGKAKPWASRPGVANTFYGMKHTEASLKLQSKAKQGAKNPMFGLVQRRVSCMCCRKELSVNTLPRHLC